MKVSIAVSIKDEQDLPSGHKRKKEGDIIAVKPAGWQWGTEEVKRYLILEVDLGSSITTIEDAQKLAVPQFEDNSLWYLGDLTEFLGQIGNLNYRGNLPKLVELKSMKGMKVSLTISGEKEIFTENNGILTGNLGGTGTINYLTGDYDISFSDAPPGLNEKGKPIFYQTENVVLETFISQTIVGKRRYKVPFVDLIAKAQDLGISVDLAKIKDEKVAYQPLEKVTIPFNDMIQDKILAKKLDEKYLGDIKKVGK